MSALLPNSAQLLRLTYVTAVNFICRHGAIAPFIPGPGVGLLIGSMLNCSRASAR